MKNKKLLKVFSVIQKTCKNHFIFGRRTCQICPFAILKDNDGCGKQFSCLFRFNPEHWDVKSIAAKYNDYASIRKTKKGAIQTAMLKKLADQED